MSGTAPDCPVADSDVLALLSTAPLEIEGQLVEASNVAVRAVLDGRVAAGLPGPTRVIYKPVRGERPLWDFPEGTLAAREVAAYLVSRAGGWDVVPPTVLRDGPLGTGSVQLWVDVVGEEDPPAAGQEDPEDKGGHEPHGRTRLLDLFEPRRVPSGWLPVLQAELADGTAVVLAHADRPDLGSVAVLDVALNNADRKGSHLALDATGRLWGFDHGVSLHQDVKLRTILWGWVGRSLPPADRRRLQRVQTALTRPDSSLGRALAPLLGPEEIAALENRVHTLLRADTYPGPASARPAIPWPPW